MFSIPAPLKKLIEAFERLPGIGPKTAQRLTFYLLHVPQSELDMFSSALSNLKRGTVICSTCFNVSDTNPCSICISTNRDESIICVVEQPLDLISLEKTGKYNGIYHVLHGAISPINNIGPDEIHLAELLPRISKGNVKEIILATNPTMEGEATAMYINNQISNLKSSLDFSRDRQNSNLKELKVTRLGQGLPIGGDMEYADDMTLTKAIEGRREF